MSSAADWLSMPCLQVCVKHSAHSHFWWTATKWGVAVSSAWVPGLSKAFRDGIVFTSLTIRHPSFYITDNSFDKTFFLRVWITLGKMKRWGRLCSGGVAINFIRLFWMNINFWYSRRSLERWSRQVLSRSFDIRSKIKIFIWMYILAQCTQMMMLCGYKLTISS